MMWSLKSGHLGATPHSQLLFPELSSWASHSPGASHLQRDKLPAEFVGNWQRGPAEDHERGGEAERRVMTSAK